MSERSEVPLVLGDRFRLKLQRRAPGQTDLVLELGGKPEGRIGVADVLERAARLDPEGADETQATIQKLRQTIGDLESKVYDQKADKGMIEALREENALLRGLKQEKKPVTGPIIENLRFQALLDGVRAYVAACDHCKGDGVLAGDAMCPKCALLRQLVKAVTV